MEEKETKAVELDRKSIQVTNSKNFPFVLVDRDGKITICAGNSQVCQTEFESIEDAETYIESRPYELIINTCCYAMQLNYEKK